MKKLTPQVDEKKIDAVFRQVDQCQLPGAVVGIAVDGRPVYRKGFGLASMELPVVLSPSIKMRIGSTTKHFAAFAFMLLCEEGKAAIDDPLGKYFPELNPVTHAVTMRQLMSNTSGLRDAIDIRFQFSGTTGRRATRADVLSLYQDMGSVNTPPGSTWIYNNGGWVLLSAVVERVAGQSFEDYMKHQVFEPIGMYDTLVRQWDTDFLSNAATPHSTGLTGGIERLYWEADFAGSGSIVSTLNDMLLWASQFERPRIGSPQTWSLMQSPVILPNGVSTGYGLGLVRSQYRGVEVVHHGGGWTGFNAQMLKVPAAGLDVVILVNRDDVSSQQLVYQVVDECIPGLAPVPQRDQFTTTGVFRSATSGRVVQLQGQNGGLIVSVDALDLPFNVDATGTLRPKAEVVHWQRSLTLIGDPSAPEGVRLNDFGAVDEMIRVPAVPTVDAKRIVGRYRSKETGSEISISDTNEGLRLHATGRFGPTACSLECLGEGVWRATTLGLVIPSAAILTLDKDNTILDFCNALTRHLRFARHD